jgi:hypothetical protein
MLRSGTVIFTLLVGAGALSAEIVPGSNCVYNPATNAMTGGVYGLTCNLYPSTNTTGGVGTFDGDVQINLANVSGFDGGPEQFTITDGYLVIVKSTATLTYDSNTGQFDDSNQSDWLQVLEFAPTATQGGVVDGTLATNYLDLFTAGCSSGNPTDTSCFPTFSTIVNSPSYNDSYIFENETLANSYFYSPSAGSSSFNPSYTINYVSPTATPEPSTFVIGFGGLLALMVALRFRSARDSSGL